jgi:hypothetical protein
MTPAKCLAGFLLFATLVAGITGCRSKKDENNELDACKQVTPAAYTDKLHFRVLNAQTGTDLLAASTPNRFTFEQLTSFQYCNQSFALEEASDFYEDLAGNDCVVFWFANLSRPHPYSAQECRRILMRWSHTDTDTLEWTTSVQPAGIPNCDSFEVLEKVFFNGEVVPQETRDGQTFYPLHKVN